MKNKTTVPQIENTTKVLIQVDDQTLENLESFYDTSIQDIGDKAFRHLYASLPLEDQIQASTPRTLTEREVARIKGRIRIEDINKASVLFNDEYVMFSRISSAIEFSKAMEDISNV